MSYEAFVYKVMISCPSDAHEERNIAREVIYSWNSVHSEASRKVLLPVDWQHDTVPDASSPPQQSIDEQITNKADMLIAVFKHNLGSSTDKEKSGTIEEIKKVIELQKHVLLYFSNKSVPQNMVSQYVSLAEYKEQTKAESYYREYSSTNDFREKLSQHIQQKAHDLKNTVSSNNPNIIRSVIINDLALSILKIAVERDFVHYKKRELTWWSADAVIHVAYTADTARKKAELDDAIKTLEQEGFICATNSSRNCFSVTKAGYDFIDSQS